MEVGVSYDSQTTWKLHGPDLNGTYGGIQGVGGLEAVQTTYSQPVVLISDARGNVLQQYDTWTRSLPYSGARPTGYGAAPGHEPVALAYGASFGEAASWRGKWKDITGYYWLGRRYYSSQSGNWLSYDSVWNVRDPNWFTFCRADPINYCDADGRFGKGIYQGYASGAQHGTDSGAFSSGYWLGGVFGVFGGFQEGWEGGRQITANTFTFGASDALGLTHSMDYQGWEYTSSRVLSTVGRESLIGAATLGSFQMARAGSEGALVTYQGLQAVNAGRSGWAIGTGIDQVS